MSVQRMQEVLPFFDAVTSTFSYVVFHPESSAAIVIDPVLDYDPEAGQIPTQSTDMLLAAGTFCATVTRWAAPAPQQCR